MENKNNVLVFSVVFLAIGIFVGWLICNNKTVTVSQTAGMHQMADGTMMGNVPMDMGSMMGGMMAGLQSKTGDDFDKAFISEMIIHHQGAIDMANEALRNAKHQEIKDLATAIISAQTKEINQMKAWNKTWYGK